MKDERFAVVRREGNFLLHSRLCFFELHEGDILANPFVNLHRKQVPAALATPHHVCLPLVRKTDVLNHR